MILSINAQAFRASELHDARIKIMIGDDRAAMMATLDAMDDEDVDAAIAECRAAGLEAPAIVDLSIDEMEVIEAFAVAHGPTWKAALANAWGNGTDCHFPDGHYLRALRNSPAYGHAWLDAYQLDVFALCTERYEALQQAAKVAGDALNAIPGIGTGPMGLTPDHIKFSPQYREAKAAYDGAAMRCKRYAALYVKWFKRELAAARKAKHAAIGA